MAPPKLGYVSAMRQAMKSYGKAGIPLPSPALGFKRLLKKYKEGPRASKTSARAIHIKNAVKKVMEKVRKISKSPWLLPLMPIPLKSPVWKVSATVDLENKLLDPIFCF